MVAKLKMTRGVLSIACSLVVIARCDALAQNAPTLTVSVNGFLASVNWTTVPSAVSYRLDVGSTTGGANLASLTYPASVPLPLIGSAPSGTYFLRVYAITATGEGPASNEVRVTLLGGCSTVAAPALTRSVLNQNVTFSWNSVVGASQYVLQLGTAPGRNDFSLQLSSTTTSYTQAVPFHGTFYARVVAHNACGQQAVSNEVPFTITCAAQQPVLTATVFASTVTFSWTGVTNPTGLAIELSRYNGQTELTEPITASAATYQRTIPLVGTFYARLAVTTSCGVTRSAYIPFTITTLGTSVRVEGVVVDADRDERVPGAVVKLVEIFAGFVSQSANNPAWSAIADANGAFGFTAVLPSHWQALLLEASRTGYQPLINYVERASAASALLRVLPILIIRPGESLQTRVFPGGDGCFFESWACRRVIVDARPGDLIDIEVIPADSDATVGVEGPGSTHPLFPAFNRRITVASGEVWLYGDLGKWMTLTATPH